MIKKGRVKEVHKDYIIVQVYKGSSCGHCKVCSEEKQVVEEIVLKTKREFEAGDSIELEMPYKTLLNFSMLVYILPILFFFGGYFIGNFLGFTEGKKILLSFLGMAACFYGMHVFDKYFGAYILSKKITIR